jgi:drug/metabolite transporter (DMT)-like permease
MAATVRAGPGGENAGMPLNALLLVLVAALLHATWNIAAKRAGGDQRFALLSALMVSVLWAPPALWLAWDELPRWTPWIWAVVLASAAVHVLYFSALLRGYRLADLTVVYPVARGSAPLVTAAAAVLLLGEHLGPLGLAGVLGVCGGVFFIAGGPGLWRRGQDAAQRARLLTGLRWGALTGALIAGYSVVDGYAVKVLLVSPVALDWLGNVLRVPLLLGAARDRAAFMQAARAQWRYALVVAVLGPAAYIAVLYAVTLAPLSHVAPAREVSMLVAALLGGKLLGESDRGWRIAGAAMIAAGVVALALG